jgi:hypothetical protein
MMRRRGPLPDPVGHPDEKAGLQEVRSLSEFAFRGLEIHSSRMWRWASVRRALDLMPRIGLNALIFHQNDLIDQLVYPAACFSVETLWKRWPVRMHTIDNNRHYLRRVIEEAKRRNIGFYLEVKEIYYPEGLLDLHPELRKPDGAVCASSPFWWTFLENKVRELLEVVPDIAGIIVSPASRESKVSISTNTCSCNACRTARPLDWYHRLLDAMYRPLAEKGKTLAVRDFSYTAEHQNLAIDAASLCSKEIVISLKNTPHDFYPTFPDNPRIGHTHGHPQWVEFDTWGQFFGIGFFPCSVVEDMQRRIDHCRRNGVTGVSFRTDWEVMTEASSFNSFNLLNVVAGGLLSNRSGVDPEEIYRAWAGYGLLSPLSPESCMETPVPLSSPEAVQRLQDFMKASWSVMEKSVYVRGHVFHEDLMFPLSLKLAFDMMTRIHGRDDWDPGASGRVEPTEENLRVIFSEKEAALREVRALPGILAPRTLGLPGRLVEEIKTMLGLYQVHVEGFGHCARACFLVGKALSSRHPGDFDRAVDSIRGLALFRDALVRRLEGTSYPHYVYWLLDTDRLQSLIRDLEAALKEPA